MKNLVDYFITEKIKHPLEKDKMNRPLNKAGILLSIALAVSIPLVIYEGSKIYSQYKLRKVESQYAQKEPQRSIFIQAAYADSPTSQTKTSYK